MTEVFDAHVNVASTYTIPEEFMRGQAENAFARLQAMGQPVTKARLTDRVMAIYQDDLADRLVGEMDAAGIDRAILLAPDFTHVADCRLDPEGLAAHHDTIRRRHPGRFEVFMGVDPRNGPDGVALFERTITDYGFRGLKLYPLCGYSPSDRALYPYYEVCAQHRVPVLCHTGPGWQALDFSFGSPLLIDGAARDFPSVDFVLAHGGVTHVDEATYLCGFRPNVYMDISGFVAVIHPDGWAAHLNSIFRTGLNHKVVFGTSWPAFKMSTSLAGIMNEFRGDVVFEGVRPKQRAMVMSGNIGRILAKAAAEPAAVGADRHGEDGDER